jgi:hypothetical protein
MPYQIKKLKKGHYQVLNELTHKIHARDTSYRKALGQLHLLGMKEHQFNKIHTY